MDGGWCCRRNEFWRMSRDDVLVLVVFPENFYERANGAGMKEAVGLINDENAWEVSCDQDV